jgi:hypothetical protein
VVIDPPIEHDHFHRSFVYIDLDEMLRKQRVSYVGTSVNSAEEWHLRKKYEGIARDVFGDGVRIKNGQIIRFRDTAARILMEQGWRPGGVASGMQAARLLRDHAEELAALVEITPARS